MTQSLASWSMYSSCLRKLKTLMAVFIFKALYFPFLSIWSMPCLPGFCISEMYRRVNNLKKMLFPYLIPVFAGGTFTPTSSLLLPSRHQPSCWRQSAGLGADPIAWAWLGSTRRGGPSPTRRASKTTLQIHKPTCSSLPPEARGSGVLHQIRSTKMRVDL